MILIGILIVTAYLKIETEARREEITIERRRINALEIKQIEDNLFMLNLIEELNQRDIAIFSNFEKVK